ncbi:phosphate ABC transporter ATP-binding protein [Lactobacillus sp. S2-2]|uniref:phosphate ABC transporter ATP-binding protein PstB n=1 Tax=Lactobacillus sp. S2-2 TaxID=2692917 RepID=UPI001F00C1C1|nr:phosphate ABC transporter ATP-binding protein PstB [Lactobacillus sp. S2-2]MCF6515317.1 phosphate ABC transporter ATP-binding protein [Lactobacillus sp. S2-2]
MKQYDLTKNNIIQFKPERVALDAKHVNVFYGEKQSTFDVSMQFPKNRIIAFIGASGSGKSTFLRCLNRMNDDVATVDGQINYEGLNINSSAINVYELRKQIGMVFQQPNPFAKSIKDNLTFALKKHGIKDNKQIDQVVKSSLKKAALYEEVQDSLNKSAMSLSGGQAQRLCIARAITMNPDILLLDEPTSALDPISTKKIEATIKELSEKYTIIMVTHNMQQASRISDYTAFFHMGHLIEYDKTSKIFTNPSEEATEDYITGHFG